MIGVGRKSRGYLLPEGAWLIGGGFVGEVGGDDEKAAELGGEAVGADGAALERISSVVGAGAATG